MVAVVLVVGWFPLLLLVGCCEMGYGKVGVAMVVVMVVGWCWVCVFLFLMGCFRGWEVRVSIKNSGERK